MQYYAAFYLGLYCLQINSLRCFQNAAFHLGLNCLQMNSLRGFQNAAFHLGLYCLQMNSLRGLQNMKIYKYSYLISGALMSLIYHLAAHKLRKQVNVAQLSSAVLDKLVHSKARRPNQELLVDTQFHSLNHQLLLPQDQASPMLLD